MTEARERDAWVAVVADRVSLPPGNIVSGADGEEADEDEVLTTETDAAFDRLLPPKMLRTKPRSPLSGRSSSMPKSEDADELGRTSSDAACDITESLFHAWLGVPIEADGW
jgi:hypothetical protein